MPQLEPVGPEFVDRAPRVVTAEIEVDVDARDLWAALTDPSTWCDWFPDMRSCEATTSDGRGLGATRQVRVGALFVDETFVVWEEERAWAFTVTRTNLPLARHMFEGVELEPIGATGAPRTRLTYTGAFTPHWLMRPVFPFVEKQIRDAWTTGLTQLGRYVRERDVRRSG